MSNKFDYLFKLIVIGDTNTGKSCLLNRFADDSYSNDFISTIGVDFKVKTIEIDGKIIKTQIWDTAGQDRFRSITSSYYRGAHGIIIAFDITNKKSFYNIEKWMKDVEKFGSDASIKMIIGTKSDLTKDRKVSEEEIQLLADRLDIRYIETSAKDNSNVNEVFVNISNELLINNIKILESNKEKKIFIETHLLKKNKNCCY